MKINKIRLYNFSSYEGENVFDFNCSDDNKNIVLIGGKNGAGKTSLFTAIKVALYGPLSYGYVGVNPHYISRIKNLINTKAFQQDVVEAEVQITISLRIEREIKKYVIARKWDYTKQKLNEDHSVEKDGIKLAEQELSYFQNYLQSIVPPDLFEFFLFDGEEVGNIFSSSSYNSYVKNAVFTLCGMDVFEIIRKYTSGYVSKRSNEDNQNLYDEYDAAKKEVEKLTVRQQELEAEINEDQVSLDNLEVQLIELETAFKSAGGITDKERKKLEEKYKDAEAKKTEAATKIKMFVEGMMPFIILKDLAPTVMSQLEYEEKGEIYNYIQDKLNKSDIEKLLKSSGINDPRVAEDLLQLFLSKFRISESHNEAVLFDLSKNEMSYVNGMISGINNFDVNGMVEIVNRRLEAADIVAYINKTLKSAMSDEDSVRYAEKENRLLKQKEQITLKLYEVQKKLEDTSHELVFQTQLKERIFQSIKDRAQNKHVYELSEGLSNMMSEFLEQKAMTMRSRLQELIVQNLKHIYRKNNLITHIEITADFQFNLYQDEKYTEDELLYLIKNVGTSEFSELIGNQGEQQLFEMYNAKNIAAIRQRLEQKQSNKEIGLFKKIELNRLSKGERQIFILSLYWAIIMLSGQDIPFIIDTPYARIDADHRKEISEKFFPNISRQVIILSTDEEINEEYYGILKPYISKEYILINDENQNKTSVENHYFFEV
ncbi:MAG: AAA family ATPase [Lachnospiraceae bacterium]|nr:AAA family ATPase [Lachnospiraceae bacterium]